MILFAFAPQKKCYTTRIFRQKNPFEIIVCGAGVRKIKYQALASKMSNVVLNKYYASNVCIIILEWFYDYLF